MKTLLMTPILTNFFPYSLGHLCTPMMNMGITPEIFFPINEGVTDKQLFEKFHSERYDMIGISAIYPSFRRVITICEIIKAASPDTVIIIGGPLVTPTPEFVLHKTGADIGAVGDAEITIVNILKALINATPLSNVQGVVCRDTTGEIINTGPGPFVENLDDLPTIPWHLFPMDFILDNHDHNIASRNERMIFIEGNRGCPYKCNFCYHPSKFRVRSIERVLNEIQFFIDEYHVPHFHIQDNFVLSSKKRTIEFITEIKRRGMKFKFYLADRLDPKDSRLISELYDCGLRGTYFGMESGSQKILDTIGKKTKVEDYKEIFSTLKENEIHICLGAMFGQPGDDQESLEKTLRMFLTNADTLWMLNVATPFPGSALFNTALDKGIIKDHEDFFNRFTDMIHLAVNFTNLSDKEFYHLYMKANFIILLADQIQDFIKGRKNLTDTCIDPIFFLRVQNYFKDKVAETLNKLKENGIHKIAVYGIGVLADIALPLTEDAAIKVVGIFDGTLQKQGRTRNGMVIRPPHELNQIEYDAILITAANLDFIEQIKCSIIDLTKLANPLIIVLTEELGKIM